MVLTERCAITLEGKREVHLHGSPVADYDTLCGIDINDPEIGHSSEMLVMTKDKVTCAACINIWKYCHAVPKTALSKV